MLRVHASWTVQRLQHCLPVLVIRLELQLGKVCFVLIFVAETNVIVIIFFELLKVISTDTNNLCT